VAIGERYATQVGVLWTGLARTLSELDQLAADPLLLRQEDVDTLRVLQDRMHCASEEAAALDPPRILEPVHSELATALAAARDATADVIELLEEDGLDAVLPCVYEWRGALFRIRLARLRLAPPRTPEEPPEEPRRDFRAPLAALLLVVAGVAIFTSGAVSGEWPIWATGMLAVCGSFIAYKP
jgi:hypothetical protein